MSTLQYTAGKYLILLEYVIKLCLMEESRLFLLKLDIYQNITFKQKLLEKS